MTRITHALFSLSLAIMAATTARAQSAVLTTADTGPYHVSQTFHVGGEGGWDYMTVDPDNKLLYVPRSTHTMVLDAATGKTVADIPGQKRNHGVAIVAERRPRVHHRWRGCVRHRVRPEDLRRARQGQDG